MVFLLPFAGTCICRYLFFGIVYYIFLEHVGIYFLQISCFSEFDFDQISQDANKINGVKNKACKFCYFYAPLHHHAPFTSKVKKIQQKSVVKLHETSFSFLFKNPCFFPKNFVVIHYCQSSKFKCFVGTCFCKFSNN